MTSVTDGAVELVFDIPVMKRAAIRPRTLSIHRAPAFDGRRGGNRAPGASPRDLAARGGMRAPRGRDRTTRRLRPDRASVGHRVGGASVPDDLVGCLQAGANGPSVGAHAAGE